MVSNSIRHSYAKIIIAPYLHTYSCLEILKGSLIPSPKIKMKLSKSLPGVPFPLAWYILCCVTIIVNICIYINDTYS